MPKLTSPEVLKSYQSEALKKLQAFPIAVSLCHGTACCAIGSRDIATAFEKALEGNEKVKFIRSGCHGFCEIGPLVNIRPLGVVYQRVKPSDVAEIVEKSLRKGEVIERLLYHDKASGKALENEAEMPFYAKQKRILLAYNTTLDPNNIDDYIAYGGYSALAKAIHQMSPDEVLVEVEKAKLRGRGGGGFDAGRKWRSCKNAQPGKPHHVVCNADEGDPGAFMDESILEGNPHLVIEGMLIGAYAIGGTGGFIYIRNEYPLAVKTFTNALKQAREYGLLGKNIIGSVLSFDIRVSRGGGAFVCGESSALFRSLEGKVGEPRAKYVHSVERGYHDEPTLLNNVETWANVPNIITKGAEWFRAIGTEKSPGTKVFSLVGKVVNTGLIEVPMGISLRDIIFGIGGGIKGGKAFKAVQTGGPSGGCVPESMLDMPVDFDELTKAGSMMGSGGMIILDEDTCVVDVARYFIDFLIEESCGKCLPCREGLRQMSALLHRICDGVGTEDDLAALERLGKSIGDCSLCALGGSSPNPVLSTIRYFRDEYLAHILDKRCPGGVCSALITYRILADLCTGCAICEKICPSSAISAAAGDAREKGDLRVIDPAECVKCGACIEICPADAIVRK